MLHIHIEIATLDDEIFNNPEYAIRKYEGKDIEPLFLPGVVRREGTDTVIGPFYKDIRLSEVSPSNYMIYFY